MSLLFIGSASADGPRSNNITWELYSVLTLYVHLCSVDTNYLEAVGELVNKMGHGVVKTPSAPVSLYHHSQLILSCKQNDTVRIYSWIYFKVPWSDPSRPILQLSHTLLLNYSDHMPSFGSTKIRTNRLFS